MIKNEGRDGLVGDLLMKAYFLCQCSSSMWIHQGCAVSLRDLETMACLQRAPVLTGRLVGDGRTETKALKSPTCMEPPLPSWGGWGGGKKRTPSTTSLQPRTPKSKLYSYLNSLLSVKNVKQWWKQCMTLGASLQDRGCLQGWVQGSPLSAPSPINYFHLTCFYGMLS